MSSSRGGERCERRVSYGDETDETARQPRITNCLLDKRVALHFLAPAMIPYLLVLTSSYYSHLTSFMMAQEGNEFSQVWATNQQRTVIRETFDFEDEA